MYLGFTHYPWWWTTLRRMISPTGRVSIEPTNEFVLSLYIWTFHLPVHVPSYHLIVTLFPFTSSTCIIWDCSWYLWQWSATSSPSWYSYVIYDKLCTIASVHVCLSYDCVATLSVMKQWTLPLHHACVFTFKSLITIMTKSFSGFMSFLSLPEFIAYWFL